MNRKRASKLKALYAKIPDANCRGLCHETCSMIGMTQAEAANMEKAGGQKPSLNENAMCSYLTPDKRCGIYEARPWICRIFGVVKDLPCPFGCKPSRLLSRSEELIIKRRIEKIGGGLVFNFDINDTEGILQKINKK